MDPSLEIPTPTPDALKRFMAQTDTSGQCWLWRGADQGAGYGRFRINYSTYKAHRVAYAWMVGPIPEGLTIDHHCQNKMCVNPSHLEAVTSAENTRRIGTRRTHCQKGHELTLENSYFPKHKGVRWCKQCIANTRTRHLERKKLTALAGKG